MKYLISFALYCAMAVNTPVYAAESYDVIPVEVVDEIEVPGALQSFISQLKAAAKRRDLAIIKNSVSTKFFWYADHGGLYDSNKADWENFAAALGLDPALVKAEFLPGKWTEFTRLLDTRRGARKIENLGETLCLPSKVAFIDETAAEKTAARFGTEPWFGMMYSVGAPAVVRDAPSQNGAVVGAIVDEAVIIQQKLRTDPELDWEPVHLPDGTTGWVHKPELLTLFGAQLCFAEETGNWKIRGYIGGGD